MSKATINALEKIWIAEINDHLPFQSKAKIYKKLEKENLVQYGEEKITKKIFGEIVIKGWYLTHLGRLLYCVSCEDISEEEFNA